LAFVETLRDSNATELIEKEALGVSLPVARAVLTLRLIALHKRERSKKINFLGLVKIGDRLLATDPRDKVYGFLRLADDQVRKYIEVDYSKSPAEVYLEIAR